MWSTCFVWWNSKCSVQMKGKEIWCFKLLFIFEITIDYCLNLFFKKSNISISNNVRNMINLRWRPRTVNFISSNFVTFYLFVVEICVQLCVPPEQLFAIVFWEVFSLLLKLQKTLSDELRIVFLLKK